MHALRHAVPSLTLKTVSALAMLQHMLSMHADLSSGNSNSLSMSECSCSRMRAPVLDFPLPWELNILSSRRTKCLNAVSHQLECGC